MELLQQELNSYIKEQGLEIITALKQGSGLLKETTTDGNSIAKAIANNRTGGSIDMKTGQLNPLEMLYLIKKLLFGFMI